MKDNKIVVGMMGLGIVSSGVAKYYQEKRSDDIYLKIVSVRDKNKKRPVTFSNITTNPYDILNDPEIDIVVELIGGEYPAKNYILDAINRRKSIVTANKVVMSRHKREIFETANRMGVDVKYEASFCGAIQKDGLKRLGNEIDTVMTINNGTCNYILTKMTNDGLSFPLSLDKAKSNGFAEEDPELDISGKDARDKLSISVSSIYNIDINPEFIYHEGIKEITPLDIEFAKELGYTIKLLAITKSYDNKLELRVNPTLIKQTHPLYGIQNEFNAIYLEGKMFGQQMYYGKGAGPETATSVICDINNIAKNIRIGKYEKLPSLISSMKLVSPEDFNSQGYIRINLKDNPKTLATIASVLGNKEININSVIQKENYKFENERGVFVPVIISTNNKDYGTMRDCLRELEKLDCVHEKPFFLRIEQ